MAQGAPTPPVPTSKIRTAASRSGKVFIEAEVPLAGVRQEGDDVFARAELASHLERHMHGGPRADPYQEPLVASERHLHVVGFAIADHADLVHHVALEVLGHEPRGEALDLRGPAVAARERRR